MAAISANDKGRIALADEFARVVQADEQQILMRGMAGELTEHERKMTATHLRQRCQLAPKRGPQQSLSPDAQLLV